MKKNFFKKLSFVLALAMIVSVLAPAAGAFAAAKAPKLNATKKYLHLSRDNEYDFNISNKQKGWKYDWSSANENVAEVNSKNGLVTATGAGSTKISVVIYDKDGEEYATLKATVVVRDNIKTVKISNAPENNTLKVNESFDFNRSYTTEANKTKGSESVTRWSVKEAGASITDAGVFTATEAGKYTVTARSFQSKAKYDAWKALKDEAATLNVLATDTVEITVAASVVSTKQVNKVKFAVTFDADMSKTDLAATTATLYKVINGTKINTGTEKIKEIKLDATGKVATVEMFAQFNPNTEYEFVYGDLVGNFKAAAVELKEVDSIQFADFFANTNDSTLLTKHVKGFNKDGVEIYNGEHDTDFANALSFSGDVTVNATLDTSTKRLYVWNKGASYTLTAKFTAYVYNDTTKVYDPLTREDGAIATATDKDTNLNTSSMQYLITNTGDPITTSTSGWATTGFKMALKDLGYYVVTKYKNNDYQSTDDHTIALGTSKFTYESSNTDKLLVNGNYLTPVGEGTVTVLVRNDDNNKTVVGSFDVTIGGERKLASAAINKTSVTISSGALGENGTNAVAEIELKDTMNSKPSNTVNVTPTLKTSPTIGTGKSALIFKTSPSYNADSGKIAIKFDASAATVQDGTYFYEFKISKDGVDLYSYLTVHVVDGTTGSVVNWRFDIDTPNVDYKGLDAAKSVNYGIYGYNNKGARVDKLESGEYTIEIKKDGNVVGTDLDKFDVVTLSGSTLTTVATGNYEIKVTLVGAGITEVTNVTKVTYSNNVFATRTISVVDTSVKTFVVDKAAVVSGGAIKVSDLVKEALTLYFDGNKVTDEDKIVGVEYYYNGSKSTDDTVEILPGQSISIISVDYNKTRDNGKIVKYTFNVNRSVTVSK